MHPGLNLPEHMYTTVPGFLPHSFTYQPDTITSISISLLIISIEQHNSQVKLDSVSRLSNASTW